MSSNSGFGYVVTMLANRLRPESPSRQSIPEHPKIVFILGAGCSKQYGLPSFHELLTCFWQDCYHEPPDSSWNFETLRDKLDQYWRTLGPAARQETVQCYLRGIEGRDCPAYLRLANLASSGRVKAIINMNFDTLLEDALDAEQVPYQVSTSFAEKGDKRSLMVYKPHGTIGKVSPSSSNNLILDIANSDLFSNWEEQKSAQDLLTNHDVLVIGYSGVDAKIVAALRAFENREDRENKKLFVANVGRPDPRLFLVMAERASQELLVIGDDGSFENFMEYLERSVEASVDFERLPSRTVGDGLTFMTRSERDALAECLRLAQSIRAGINVADRSQVTIEEHGHEIYHRCLKLANAAGDCLRPPEKFLLYAAAFLHDLGYFAAYSGGNALNYPGWKLLNVHGQKTRSLIEQRVSPDERISILPDTYSNHRELRETLLYICANHSTWRGKLVTEPKEEVQLVQVCGREVQVRPRLLQALFAAAEDLAMEHPFLPSPDPVIANEESRWVVEDPVLDLFLRRKKDEVVFEIERGKVVGRTRDGQSSKTALWLLNDVSQYVNRYGDESRKSRPGEGAATIAFVCDPRRRLLSTEDGIEWETEVTELLAEALEDGLSESLRRVQEDIHNEVVDVLAAASGKLRALRKDSAELAIAGQVLDSLQRSLSKEWIFDLFMRGREVEALAKRLVREHGRLLRSAQQEIFRLDSEVRELLRSNIPELVRTRVWFRLPSIEEVLREIESLLSLSAREVLPGVVERWGFLLEDLQENIEFLRKSVEGGPLAERLENVCPACCLAALECARREIESWRSGDTNLTIDSIQKLVPVTSYLQKAAFFEADLKEVLILLLRVEHGLRWQREGVDGGLLESLIEAVQKILDSASDRREEAGTLRELVEDCRVEAGRLRGEIDNIGVNEALRSLSRVREVVERIPPESGRSDPDTAEVLELLAKAVRSLQRPAGSYVTSVLDLLAIYTLGGEDRLAARGEGRGGGDQEPRVSLMSRTVIEALSWIEGAEKYASNLILDTYFRVRQKSEEERSPLEEALSDSFEKIIYPAWRFFGRNLHDGIESILMAVICFDLGSSRFRDEAVSGIRRLLGEDFVTWNKDRDREWAYGHDGCTLCTSRLLYIFSHARRLFPQEEIDSFNRYGKGIDKTVRGLLQYFLRRPEKSKVWSGLEFTVNGSQIDSADYLAWAARSVMFCLSVDKEIEGRTGESWLSRADMLGADRERLKDLLKQRWSAILEVEEAELLGEGAEEPHSLILGGVAIACLDLLRQKDGLEGFELERPSDRLDDLSRKLSEGKERIGKLSTLSRFFIWPVQLLRHRIDELKGGDSSLTDTVRACYDCIRSPIWIREGMDAGSWGFNVKNTQAVVSSLIEFWRYALDSPDRRVKFEKEFERVRPAFSSIQSRPSLEAPEGQTPPGLQSSRKRDRRGASAGAAKPTKKGGGTQGADVR